MAGGQDLLSCACQVVNWFTEGLDYEYIPSVHGSQPEWLADLISTSFTQPLKTFKRSMRSRKVCRLTWVPHMCMMPE